MMAGPNGELDWHVPYWNEEMSHAAAEQLGKTDTLLLGRVTYQSMAAYWQGQQYNFGARQDADFAAMMNNCEKVVFSRSLKQVDGWYNSRLAKRNTAKEIAELKQRAGQDLLVYGSGKLVNALMKYDLVDEYRLWVYPVALNEGRALFRSKNKLNLIPIQIKTFNNGVVLICYTKSAIINNTKGSC